MVYMQEVNVHHGELRLVKSSLREINIKKKIESLDRIVIHVKSYGRSTYSSALKEYIWSGEMSGLLFFRNK